uniref:Acetylcholinesterase n=1 Tax=Parastrongyloides trichosuri TaxID=131310 RepID=A0A0N5A5M3_PARTI
MEEIKLGLKYLEVLYKWPIADIKRTFKTFKFSPGKTNRDRMITAISDFLFNCDNVHFAEKSSANNNSVTYYFEFNKKSTVNPWPEWMGAMHGYELEYVFGMPYVNSSIYNLTLLANEKQYANKIMGYYGSFAKLGYPDSNWHPYKPINTSKTNNSYCAILDKNLTKNNHVLQYRSILTDKCELLNEVAQNHPPRKPPSQSMLSYVYNWLSSSLSSLTLDNLKNQIMLYLSTSTNETNEETS